MILELPMKEGFNGELAKLRDEVADESQILMKVVSWYSKNLYYKQIIQQ